MAKIFGIINLSQDSFSGDGVSDINKIKEYIEKIAQFGLYGIDVGAMSTKPNGDFVSEFDELKRL
jgi:dihydropteroate synthase